MPNLRLQIDYFDIKIENVITTIGADAILQQCYNAGNFCNDIHRDANGSLWLSNDGFVIDSLANVGKLETRGVDIDLSYGFDISAAGKIRTNLVGSYVDEYIVTPIAADPSTKYNFAGLYGDTCSGGASTLNPIFPLAAHAAHDVVDALAGARYHRVMALLLAMKLDSTSPQANLSAFPATVANGGIASSDTRINAFNFPQLYDALGRFIFGQLTVQF